MIVGEGDGWQACQGSARQAEASVERGVALQLEAEGAGQRRHEEEGEGEGLQGEQGAVAIPWGDTHPLGQAAEPCTADRVRKASQAVWGLGYVCVLGWSLRMKCLSGGP